MKVVKIIVISFTIILIFILAFSQKSDKVNIEGNWKVEKIILNGKLLFPTKFHKFFDAIDANNEIIINKGIDSLHIYEGRDKISAGYIIKKINGKYQIRLSSNEKSLNGNFNFKIDTLHFDTTTYQIQVEIESDSTLIYFNRKVNIKPWQPRNPVRGLP